MSKHDLAAPSLASMGHARLLLALFGRKDAPLAVHHITSATPEIFKLVNIVTPCIVASCPADENVV